MRVRYRLCENHKYGIKVKGNNFYNKVYIYIYIFDLREKHFSCFVVCNICHTIFHKVHTFTQTRPDPTILGEIHSTRD